MSEFARAWRALFEADPRGQQTLAWLDARKRRVVRPQGCSQWAPQIPPLPPPREPQPPPSPALDVAALKREVMGDVMALVVMALGAKAQNGQGRTR